MRFCGRENPVIALTTKTSDGRHSITTLLRGDSSTALESERRLRSILNQGRRRRAFLRSLGNWFGRVVGALSAGRRFMVDLARSAGRAGSVPHVSQCGGFQPNRWE